MHLQHGREGALASRLIEAREALFAAMALIDQIPDHELESALAACTFLSAACAGQCRCAQHRRACLQQGSPSNCTHGVAFLLQFDRNLAQPPGLIATAQPGLRNYECAMLSKRCGLSLSITSMSAALTPRSRKSGRKWVNTVL